MRSILFFLVVMVGLAMVLGAEEQEAEQVREKRSWGAWGWPWGGVYYAPSYRTWSGVGWYTPVVHGWHG